MNTINFNDIVKVKLTDIGIKRFEERQLAFRAALPKVKPSLLKDCVDSEGYISYHLWDLMATYGDLMRLGVEPPFESEIIILEQ
jgi:hypothetical protein